MNPDFLDLLRALLDAEARFLVVGAYALGVHGRPRATKDLDVWVEATDENAPRVMRALREFGAPLLGLTLDDLRKPGVGLQIGIEPGRIDILTEISGVRFEEAWPQRLETALGGGAIRCCVIGLEHLIRNKKAAARPQDLVDIATLERLQSLRR